MSLTCTVAPCAASSLDDAGTDVLSRPGHDRGLATEIEHDAERTPTATATCRRGQVKPAPRQGTPTTGGGDRRPHDDLRAVAKHDRPAHHAGVAPVDQHPGDDRPGDRGHCIRSRWSTTTTTTGRATTRPRTPIGSSASPPSGSSRSSWPRPSCSSSGCGAAPRTTRFSIASGRGTPRAGASVAGSSRSPTCGSRCG